MSRRVVPFCARNGDDARALRAAHPELASPQAAYRAMGVQARFEVDADGNWVSETRPFLPERSQAAAARSAEPALVPSDRLADVLRIPGVIGVEEAQAAMDDAGQAFPVNGPTVDGYDLTDLLQSHQFYDEGYYGSARLALVEPPANNVRRSHPGFGTMFASGQRFANCGYNMFYPNHCYGNADADPGAAHATATASILIGDITQHQDPTYACGPRWGDVLQCEQRSGVARGATALGVTNSHLGHAVSVISAPSEDIRILSESSTNPYWHNCNGTSSWARDVTSDVEGCGANSARVSYAYLWEDSDRDDDAYLQQNIRVE